MNARKWLKKCVLICVFMSTTAVWADETRQRADQVEKLQKRIVLLERRLRDVTRERKVVADDKAVFIKYHKKKLDELSAQMREMNAKNDRKIARQEHDLAKLNKELKDANRIVTDAQRQLIVGLKSGNSTIRDWLYQHLAKLKWPQKNELNKLIADLEPTPRQRFEAARKTKADYEFVDMNLQEAIDFWSELYAIEVKLDPALKRSLKNNRREILLNGTLKKTNLETALKTFLKPVGLTYKIGKFVIIVIPKK